MSVGLEQGVGPSDGRTTGSDVASRRPWASYALAAALAASAVLVPVFALILIIGARDATGIGPSALSDMVFFGCLLYAIAAGVAAVVVGIVAWRSRSSKGYSSAPAATADAVRRSDRTRRLWTAFVVVVVSGLVLLVFWQLGLGYGFVGDLVLLATALIALTGMAAAAVLVVRAVWPGRPTSLRTRAFIVIAGAVLVPSVCLALLGAWAYYRSWDTATSLYSDQAYYRASELADEVASVQRQRDRFSPSQRAFLMSAIAAAYGRQGHTEGAQLATLSQLRATHTLPKSALRTLQRQGFVVRGWRGPPRQSDESLVAWLVDSQTVRYYVPEWTGTTFSPPTPIDRLLWIAVAGVALVVVVGLLGAWLISRSVVGPVRRLAEASGRLADGESDVTVVPQGSRELRDLAVSFNDMNAKLTKAQETEQAFLLSVSHELKTPLTSIRGYAEGIGDGTIEPPEGSAVIGAESTRLERLVGDLLESGRLRKSAFTVRREPVDLALVAQDVARRYEVTARDAGLTLLLNTEFGGMATADHDRVLQVVSNLVENAIRCTPAPGTVTISTAPAAISVADTGRGLTSDDLPRAFERFYLYSRYGTDRPVGTGLGLAIVKELAEAMGGAVSVSSAVGVGTAFTVALPAASGSPAAPRIATEQAGPTPVTPDTGSPAPAPAGTTVATAAPTPPPVPISKPAPISKDDVS